MSSPIAVMPTSASMGIGTNFGYLLIFYSPIILAVMVVGFTLAFQSIKGIFYIAFLLLFAAGRLGIYNSLLKDPINKSKTACNSVIFSQYGNSSFSGFVFAFTLIYLIGPMILNSNPNVPLIIGLIFYYVADIYTRGSLLCYDNSDYFANSVAGALLGVLSVGLLKMINSGQYLFFNETSSEKEQCSMPSKQQFKCQVLNKSGEVIADL